MNILETLKRRVYALFSGDPLASSSTVVSPVLHVPLLPWDIVGNHILPFLLEEAVKTRRQLGVLSRVCHWTHMIVSQVDTRITVEYAFSFQPKVSPYRIPTGADFSHFPNIYAMNMFAPIIRYDDWRRRLWCNRWEKTHQQPFWTWDLHFNLLDVDAIDRGTVNAPNRNNYHSPCRILELHQADEISRVIRTNPIAVWRMHLLYRNNRAEYYSIIQKRLVRSTQTMIQILKRLLRDSSVPDDCRILEIFMDPLLANNFVTFNLLPQGDHHVDKNASAGIYTHPNAIPFSIYSVQCSPFNALWDYFNVKVTFMSWTAGVLRAWFKPSVDVYDEPLVPPIVNRGKKGVNNWGQISLL